jgi:hypothetical protein
MGILECPWRMADGLGTQGEHSLVSPGQRTALQERVRTLLALALYRLSRRIGGKALRFEPVVVKSPEVHQ